jgi:hypothetical protein
MAMRMAVPVAVLALPRLAREEVVRSRSGTPSEIVERWQLLCEAGAELKDLRLVVAELLQIGAVKSG